VKLWIYVVRRLILLVPTIIGLTFLVFALEHVGGTSLFLAQYINPHLTGTARQKLVEELTAKFHLNDPVYIQYFYWLGAIFQGDMGTSTTIGQPVATGFVWFMLKVVFVFFMFAMVKAFVPRYRYDQLMRLGWKVFLPLSLVMVVAVAAVLHFFELAP